MHQSNPAAVADADADRAYTVEEAAERIGVCVGTIYNEAADGRLVLRKLRRRTICTSADLAAYLATLPPLPCDRPAAA
jgi:excisionase family DNA binding protein